MKLPVPDANGSPIYCFSLPGVSCTCGVPTRDMFPCSCMKAAALYLGVPEDLLVRYELHLARWREQYPRETTVTVPTIPDVNCSAIPADEKLRVPITATPRCGRPNFKRKLSVIEKVLRILRMSYGR